MPRVSDYTRELRELIRKTGEALDSYDKPILLLAPTGYGKTTLSLALYKYLRDGGRDLGVRLIHVLPLRSIGDQLYQKAKGDDVGLQHMGFAGSPLLGKRFNITTLDTFIFSLFKLPPFEMGKVARGYSAHYEVSRGHIFSSIVVFDEIHLYFQNPKMSASFLESLEVLSNARVPMVLMTATLPEEYKKEIKGVIDFEEIGPNAPDAVKSEVRFEKFDGDLIEKVNELRKNGSVAVMLNTVKRAVDVYKKIKKAVEEGGGGGEVVLIHGRLAEVDRAERVKKVNGELPKGMVVVTTQVVEAGVDFSADFGITASAPPENLKQRAGRVNRYGKNERGTVYVLPPEEEDIKIYGERAGYFWKTGKLDMRADSPRVDKLLKTILRQVNASMYLNSDTVYDYIRRECSLTREEDVVSAVPVELLGYSSSSEIVGKKIDYDIEGKVIPLELKKGKYTVLYRDGRVGEYEFKYKCMSVEMMEENIVAVLVEGYDREVGLVG